MTAPRGERADVVAVLTEQHRELERALSEVLKLPPGDSRRRSHLKDTAVALAGHTTATQCHLHHAVRRYLPHDGDRLVRQQDTDLLHAEEAMKDLEFTGVDSGEFDTLVRQLIRRVRRHSVREEASLFPRLRGSTPAAVLDELGDAVREVGAQAACLRSEVEHSRRPDVIGRIRAALAPDDARAAPQAEQFDRFLTGDGDLSGI